MLKAWFNWLDQNHWSYWAIACVPTALLVAWLAATLLRGPHTPERDDHPARGDWRYALLLFVVLLGWRWPPLFGIRDLNPDESWMLAGALTLRHDPVFWRSVDGITSGPLNFYALLPLNLLGVPLDYFGARLTGLLMVGGALAATYAMLRSAYGTTIARFAVLPGLAFFAGATDADFIHYSSEHPSILLSCVAMWLLWAYRPRADSPPGSVSWPWLAGGAVTGLLPWAKLQSGPLGAALALWGAWLAWSNFDQPWRARVAQIAKLAAATLAPSLAFVLLLLAVGVFPDFYKSYVLDNLTYVAQGFEVWGVIDQLKRMSLFTWHYPACLIGPLTFVLLSAFITAVRGTKPSALYVFSLLLTGVACYVVLAPGRGFHHYLLYSVMPLAAWAGAAFGDLLLQARARSRWLAAATAVAFFGLTFAYPLLTRHERVAVPWIFGKFLEYWRHPHDDVGLTLLRYRRAGDTLAIWGWYGHAYVQSQLPQATREAESEHQLREWPLRDSYFRPQYMADLRRNQPALFVDATGPGAFFFEDRARFSHETFGELNDYVTANYQLVLDAGHARIYVRKDRAAEVGGESPGPKPAG